MNRMFLMTGERKSIVTALLVLGWALSFALWPSCPARAEEAEELPPPTAGQGIMLNFRDAPLDAVLTYLSEATGLVVVGEVDVQGRISIIGRQPLSVSEAISLLNTVLKERGYAAIQMGRTLKIISLDDAKKANVPVRSGNDPEMIEPTDEVLTQIVPLRFVDAAKLKDDLAPLIPSYAVVTANASSNTLIITDTAANIRRIVEIVRALDTHLATVAEVKVFQLKYAYATNVAALVNEIFKEEPATSQQTAQAAFRSRFFRGPGEQPGGAAVTEQTAGPSQKVTAAADERTNTLVISAPPDTMKVIEAMVNELDANPAQEQAVFDYPLKNAKAANLAKVLNDLFGGSAQTVAGTAGRQTQQTRQSQRGGQTSQTTAQSADDLYGQVYLVADEDTNSLLVMTPPKNSERVKELLAEMDRPVPQVLIKVLVAEVTRGKSIDLGVEFSAMNLRPSGRGTELSTDFGIADETGGLVISVLEADVTAALRALEEVGKLDVLSRPYILTSDNQAASITVGQRVPIPTQSRTTETGQTINTITYEDIGIIMNVTPHINPDGLVIMDINPEISTVSDSTVPISETFNAPIYNKRSAQSRVAILDGQTIVIGGLVQDQKTETVTKVPLLGDVPVLGYLFRRTEQEKSKTELLIFLTPHVAKEPAALQNLSDNERVRSKTLSDAVAPGTFEEHMEGMQSGVRRTDGE